MEAAIVKPMLATALDDQSDVVFPVLATPKIDGIRALMVNGSLVSRSLKMIPNRRVREALESVLPDGADGEIVYGDTFQEATSAVMTAAFVPAKPFTFYWFDYVRVSPDTAYDVRMEDIRRYLDKARLQKVADVVRVIPLFPERISTAEELDAFEAKCLDDAFEGVMIRKPEGRYKYGRSTVREGLLLKIKRFQDAEARVVDVEELQHNLNEAVPDNLGHAKRSSLKANKRAGKMLGALVVETDAGVRFKIGTGFTAKMRTDFWRKRKDLIGQLVKYKYLSVGVKDAPRHPVFLGFRSEEDVS